MPPCSHSRAAAFMGAARLFCGLTGVRAGVKLEKTGPAENRVSAAGTERAEPVWR